MRKDSVGKFWVVTAPRLHSMLSDICFETTVEGFALQVKGGLELSEVLGTFRTNVEAEHAALALLDGIAKANRLAEMS